MTSAPVRDPLADHLLTPQNAAFLLIDYQPSQLADVRSMGRDLLVKNTVSTVKAIKTFEIPVVHSGKVIVDPTNPVGPVGAGGYKKVIGEQESSGQILAGLLPAGARLVKAFGTLSAPTLSSAAWQEPERAVQFYAADDNTAGDLVADLIRADGYEPVRVGGLDQSIRIEMFGDLHEYGALGRAVTKTDALAAV